MDKLVRKVLGAIAGVAICVAIWTIQDKLTGGGNDVADSIPSEVWGGGGGVVTIEAEANQPAVLSASFENNLAIDDPNHQYLETWQKIPAGKHTFDIDVPANVGGSVELRVDEASVGAKIKVAVLIDGRVVSESSDHLDQPLEAGYGFAAGMELEDYARGQVAEAGWFFDD
jgi:hypothetical protein